MSQPHSAGTILHRRYKVVRVAGEGDEGVLIYLAHDQRAQKGQRRVALKQMPALLIVDCERQADLRGTLHHSAIPRVLGYFSTAKYAYLVQEFILGTNLEQALQQQSGFLPEKTVLNWAIQICSALHYLHTHPLQTTIFRDLKPNNVMVNRSGRIYLVDFGLARVFPSGFFQAPRPEFKHLRKALAIGTAGYSPPEQYRGIVTPQSDIYALGATLHHLLTKRDPRKERPFTFQHFPVRSLNPAISRGLEAIVMQAVQRPMKQRFQSAEQMLRALEALTG